MKTIRIAAVGYGNIGQKAVEAIQVAPDMELAGIVELPGNIEAVKSKFKNVPVVSNINDLDNIDVAVISVDSHVASKVAIECLQLGINTVDPYDNYSEPLLEYRKKLDDVAKENNVVSVICAGWDPGTDGMIRAIMEIIVPRGLTFTNFGPGMSMSHTATAKTYSGIKDAFSLTLPKGTGLHKRMLYIELEEGIDVKEIESDILKDDHFSHDEVHIIPVPSVNEIKDTGHGVLIERKGFTGKMDNHRAQYTMSISNVATTSQIMVSSARAALKQKPGCYTLLEIPPIDFLYGDKDKLLKRLV